MKIIDLRSPPKSLENSIVDAKEGIVDALLNLTWQRVSGTGQDGETIYGTKPSLKFVSGFLLPRFDDVGQEDETSDIHLSTLGIDCQIDAESNDEIIIEAQFSIYVRAIPSWDELNRSELDLFPNPPLKQEIEQQIRDAMKNILQESWEAEKKKPEGERRARKDIQQDIYKALLAAHGVEVSNDSWIVNNDEIELNSQVQSESDGATALLKAQRGKYIFNSDHPAKEIDIPQKWKRLEVKLLPLSISLSDATKMVSTVTAWNLQMQQAVKQTVLAWLQTEDGSKWAYRPANIRPSNFKSETAWGEFIAGLRAALPLIDDIAPSLNGLSLAVTINDDLRDSKRKNLRVILENNSNEIGKRRRHRFDHAIHQVEVKFTMPKKIHLPLCLDRVESSYRFRDFLTYAAIGINCGVNEKSVGSNLILSTTWMPKYQQPRIVPNEIPGAPMEFSILASNIFNPDDLYSITKAYTLWIDRQSKDIDPAQGVFDQDEIDREHEKFDGDIEKYKLEVKRINLGIDLLKHAHAAYKADPASNEAIPYKAWLYLNETFLESGSARGITTWRLFQLTFILAHLPTIVSRMPEYSKSPWFDPKFDEETATLLYFSTGGGKSEAFFGLLIFNLFFDRLRGKEIGITALIRYPLRLLTLQQAQRLLSVLMHAEFIKRKAKIKGQPFEIGFWVGSGNTPNNSSDARLKPVPKREDPKHINDETSSLDYREVNDSFNKIPNCPSCKSHTGLRRVHHHTAEEISIVCFNKNCNWNIKTENSPLPFLIIDQDIYRHAPAVLLGVIDKLALIGQHPSTINRVMGMFGLARWQELGTGRLVMPMKKMIQEGSEAHSCNYISPAYKNGKEIFRDPFPSLIIQDEAHLLDESLGTFAGLFETILENLFTRAASLLGDRVARSPFGAKAARLPKVIAATATVSVPQQQFGSLYQRRHMHFPYPGTSIYESFYAKPAQPINSARKGIGNNTPRAPEIEAPWMRVYTAIMTNGRNHTVTTVSILAAYHLAITEIWQDLQSEEKRPQTIQRLLDSLTKDGLLRDFHADALEKCSKDSDLFLTLIDLMKISLTYVTNKKGGDQVIDAFREEVTKVHHRFGRELGQLNTKLISGGVDVAEIQEIMREAEGQSKPGDNFPELESSLRNIVATSAISHGVDVDKFNAMFFAGMPNDIAEFIQASSRVGRSHVGFSLLIPTPHARRDRYIVETYDIFHRFLERMIAPPAITRWAATAHKRVLTSLFQAWLCGWVEQKIFFDKPDEEKNKALIFENVNDVEKMLSGKDFPGAAKDFMEFSVMALGIPGRGVDKIGSAPHAEYYDGLIRNLCKELTDQIKTQYTTTRLSEYWENSPVGQKPMTSLRDIDESGRFIGARGFGNYKTRGEEEKDLIKTALRIVRRQRGRVGELDSEDGEL
ncbi:MAG: helicase-related protein [Alphaproteobacteria bacterium]